jgi:hypothetical protein
MGLKAFHILFVTVATVLCFLFGGWCWRYASTSSDLGGYKLLAAAAFVAGLGLIVYGSWFYKKISADQIGGGPGKGAALVLVLLTWLVAQPAADACTVCYGEAEGPMIDAARSGVWLLFGLVGSVQISFVAFFVYLWRRGRKFRDAASLEESTLP